MDEVRKGRYKELMKSDQLISGKENGVSIFARGHCTVGREFTEQILETIRKLINTCTNFKGFIIFDGVHGGAGSGLTAFLLEKLANEYTKSNSTTFSVYNPLKIAKKYSRTL